MSGIESNFMPFVSTIGFGGIADEMLKIYKSLCFGYESIKEAIKLNFVGKKHMVQAYHHSVYDFIKLFNDLNRLLVWNKEQEYLYRKLKLEISN